MTISLEHIGKRYQQHWIFKGISTIFEPGKRYALLGANGSGKSTLLRIIAGIQQASKGTVRYSTPGKNIPEEQFFRHISYCAPAMEVVEELTLQEFLQFHFSFKPVLPGHSAAGVIDLLGLRSARHKFIHEFSSGMKQRVKLAQAFFTDSAALLLDEPCSNLDQQGVALYQEWLERHTANRVVIVASNDPREYTGATTMLTVEDFK